MKSWKIVCPYCNKEVSKADIDFIDKRICIDCARKEKEEMWHKNNNKVGGGNIKWKNWK